jgi:O-antigen ligase
VVGQKQVLREIYMRESSFRQIAHRKQFNSGLFVLLAAALFGVLTAYLITTQSYLSFGVLVFAVFLIFSSFIVNPKIFIYLLVISIPLSLSNFELFNLNKFVAGAGNVPVHLSHILAVILIFIAAIRMMPRIEQIKIGVIGKAILLIVFAYFISIIGVYQAYHGFSEYSKSLINILLFAMLYFAFINSITRQDTVIKIFKIWVTVSLLVAIYGFYQLLNYFIPSLPLIAGTEIMKYGGILRVTSILVEPTAFAKCVAYPAIFMFVMVVERQRFPFKTLRRNVIVLLLLLTALMLSFSLTAYLYLSLFLLFFAFSYIISFRNILRKLGLPLIMIAVILIAIVSTDMGQGFLARFSLVLTLADASTIWRIHTLSIAWEEFLKYPLFGIGAGNFPLHTATGIFQEVAFIYTVYEFHHSDTLVFQILAEMGIVGFIAIVLFFGTMLTALRKVIGLNKAKDLNFHISKGLFFMLLIYIISTLVVSGWLEFWVWFIFSVVGTWVLLEYRRLREI